MYEAPYRDRWESYYLWSWLLNNENAWNQPQQSKCSQDLLVSVHLLRPRLMYPLCSRALLSRVTLLLSCWDHLTMSYHIDPLISAPQKACEIGPERMFIPIIPRWDREVTASDPRVKKWSKAWAQTLHSWFGVLGIDHTYPLFQIIIIIEGQKSTEPQVRMGLFLPSDIFW